MKNQLGTLTILKYFQYKIVLLIISAIAISLGLVVISMSMYISSGTIQLDLSRPGYIGVSDQTIISDKPLTNFPQFGSLEYEDILYFEKQFLEQAGRAKAVEAFSGDPLDPIALGLEELNN